MRKWAVSISLEGKDILFISDNEISGVDNVEEYRNEILDCVQNVMSFIGVKETKADICRMGGLHDWTDYDVNMHSHCKKCGIDLFPF